MKFVVEDKSSSVIFTEEETARLAKINQIYGDVSLIALINDYIQRKEIDLTYQYNVELLDIVYQNSHVLTLIENIKLDKEKLKESIASAKEFIK